MGPEGVNFFFVLMLLQINIFPKFIYKLKIKGEK